MSPIGKLDLELIYDPKVVLISCHLYNLYILSYSFPYQFNLVELTRYFTEDFCYHLLRWELEKLRIETSGKHRQVKYDVIQDSLSWYVVPTLMSLLLLLVWGLRLKFQRSFSTLRYIITKFSFNHVFRYYLFYIFMIYFCTTLLDRHNVLPSSGKLVGFPKIGRVGEVHGKSGMLPTQISLTLNPHFWKYVCQ